MKKYKVFRVSDNKLLSEWNSDFADHTHYEENWGKPQHNVELTPRIENEDGAITEATYETIPSEYVLEESDITAEVEQQRINVEAEMYLQSTDWMVIRSIDGIAVPAEVTLERIAARARIIR